jgi:hypothetical protein
MPARLRSDRLRGRNGWRNGTNACALKRLWDEMPHSQGGLSLDPLMQHNHRQRELIRESLVALYWRLTSPRPARDDREPRIVLMDEDDNASFEGEIGTTDVLPHVLKPVTAAMIAAIDVNTIDSDTAPTFLVLKREWR